MEYSPSAMEPTTSLEPSTLTVLRLLAGIDDVPVDNDAKMLAETLESSTTGNDPRQRRQLLVDVDIVHAPAKQNVAASILRERRWSWYPTFWQKSDPIGKESHTSSNNIVLDTLVL